MSDENKDEYEGGVCDSNVERSMAVIKAKAKGKAAIFPKK